MNSKAYEVDIRPLSPEDGGGGAGSRPGPSGCVSDGETAQVALENAYDAITCWIEAAREMGRSVPPPKRMAA